MGSGVVNNTKNVSFKVPVTKIDTRSQYAFFEFNVRTSDKVELVLEGTIFWQVIDVEKMIHNTGDPKGDVWYHVRSALIQAVSRVTFEQQRAAIEQTDALAKGNAHIFLTPEAMTLKFPAMSGKAKEA